MLYGGGYFDVIIIIFDERRGDGCGYRYFCANPLRRRAFVIVGSRRVDERMCDRSDEL